MGFFYWMWLIGSPKKESQNQQSISEKSSPEQSSSKNYKIIAEMSKSKEEYDTPGLAKSQPITLTKKKSDFA